MKVASTSLMSLQMMLKHKKTPSLKPGYRVVFRWGLSGRIVKLTAHYYRKLHGLHSDNFTFSV